jgi:hypothetical protein
MKELPRQAVCGWPLAAPLIKAFRPGGNVDFRRYVVLLTVLLASVFSHATTPQVTSTDPTSGTMSAQVHIYGSGFGTTQGTVKFNAAYSGSIVTWADSQIVVTVPAQAFTGPILVTAGGFDSNSTVYFNVPAPQITSISPASGGVGTQVTINGSGFQNPKAAASSIKIQWHPWNSRHLERQPNRSYGGVKYDDRSGTGCSERGS